MGSPKKKKKLNLKRLIIFILILYILIFSCYNILDNPIKNVVVKNNNYLSDAEIIETAGLKNYPNFIKIRAGKIEKKLFSNDLINSVEVKKNLLGEITIIVEENNILFVNNNTNRIVLSNGKEVPNKYELSNVPLLINFVPKDILATMIKYIKRVDSDALLLVSEIEYNPSQSKDGKILDENRFLLRMNDGNTIYINSINIDNLNLYPELFASFDNRQGILYLDSNNKDSFLFTEYKKVIEEEVNSELPA